MCLQWLADVDIHPLSATHRKCNVELHLLLQGPLAWIITAQTPANAFREDTKSVPLNSLWEFYTSAILVGFHMSLSALLLCPGHLGNIKNIVYELSLYQMKSLESQNWYFLLGNNCTTGKFLIHFNQKFRVFFWQKSPESSVMWCRKMVPTLPNIFERKRGMQAKVKVVTRY